jgi:hypothetical protein
MASENGSATVLELPAPAPASALVDHAELESSTSDGVDMQDQSSPDSSGVDIPEPDALVEPELSEPEGEESKGIGIASEDAPDGVGMAEELTKTDTWVGNSAIKKEWIAVRTKAETLFGHKTGTLGYVAFMYMVRTLHLSEANLAEKEGRTFKRSDFIKTLTDFLNATTTIPKSMIEVSLWLQAVGLLELVRAKPIEGSSQLAFPGKAPESDWFRGNLCYTTLKALAPLVRVEKGDGADTYSWVPGCAQVGIDMVEQLRSGSLPASASYVIQRRKDLQDKAEKALAAAQKKKLSADQVRLQEIQEQAALLKKRRDEVSRLGKSIAEKAVSYKFSPDEVRSQLVGEGVIPALGQSEVVGVLDHPDNRATVITAMVSNVDVRKALVEALAKVITHQDVNTLVSGMFDHFKKTSDAGTKSALAALKNAFTPKEGAAKS